MTDTPVPDAAVQIVMDMLDGYATIYDARRAVAGLARAGWLHDPAEVAALRAVERQARALDSAIGQWAGISLSPEVARTWIELEDALDALLDRAATPAEAEPQCRCGHGWSAHSDIDGTCARCTCDQYDGDAPAEGDGECGTPQ